MNVEICKTCGGVIKAPNIGEVPVAQLCMGCDYEDGIEEYAKCIRCGIVLSPEHCDDEFLKTGICANCWLPEDEYDV